IDLKYQPESFNDKVADLKEVVRLMKQYGGDAAWKIYANEIEQFIRITAWDYFETGLVTRRGMIRIDDIPGMTSEFKCNFIERIAYCREKETTTQEERNSIEHELAIQIKKIIAPNIKIYTDRKSTRLNSSH